MFSFGHKLNEIKTYVLSRRHQAISCVSQNAAKIQQRTKQTFEVDKHKAFEELSLKRLKYEDSFGRLRHHVNPLSIQFQFVSEALDWEKVYKNPELPLIVDVGSGYGRFPLVAAKHDTTPTNYLGTDIRHQAKLSQLSLGKVLQLVGRANFWAEELELDDRVHFTCCNITLSLESLLEGYPGPIIGIYIQFPDPMFKKRNLKRHIVQENFVEACAKVLDTGGTVFMQTDVESNAIYMRNMFDRFGSRFFEPHSVHNCNESTEEIFMEKQLKWNQLDWIEENPIGTPTEREVYSQHQGFKVFRFLLVKKASDS